MKRLSTIIMALALVLGMSQCKKQETPTTGNTTPSNPGVHITVNVGDQDGKDGKDNNGEKHNIAPDYGLFAFTKNDKLYVGHNGKYVGMLTFNGACFDGTIYPDATVTDNLHFYFLGNAAISQSNDTIYDAENPKTTIGISIADQHENLPVLSYGASKQTYSAGNTSYSATLKNKCALVRFDLQNTGDYTVTLSGVPTQATVDFATNAITPNTSTTGDITLYGESGNTAYRWAILLPGTDLSTGHSDLSTTGYEGSADLTNLNNNDYINSGISINNPLPLPAAPDAQYAVKTSAGTLTQFSVSANKKVYFSRANLKCNAANPNQLVWDFHDNQIDECPGFGAINSTSGTGTNGIHITSSDEMDRFSWGFHSPTTISEDDWVDGSRNLSRADGTDWGCALIGTGYGDNWRTLTAAEWEYLLKTRSGKRFLRASWKLYYNNSIVITNGIFIAPDGYTGGSSYTEWNKIGSVHKFNTDVTSVNALLNDGCVFLPALGYRQGSYYYEYNYHYSIEGWYMAGNYWTATGVDQQPGSQVTPQAKALRFTDEEIKYEYSPQRNLGMCVRLVWDAN